MNESTKFKIMILVSLLSFLPTLSQCETLRNRAISLLGDNEILFIERKLANTHLVYGTFGANADDLKSIYPHPGSAIRAWDPTTGSVRDILVDPDGLFRDLRIHYDGKNILFAWRKKDTPYHLWEMNLTTKEKKQLTFGKYDDFDATYLPDGGWIFASGRCRRFIPCNRVQTAILYRMEADRKTLYPVSSNVLLEDRPTLLPDGRIVYTRWDYVDRATETFRDLWVMNPDGTGQALLYNGSATNYPTLYKDNKGRMRPRSDGFWAECDAMPIPGHPNEIITIFSPAFGYRENAGLVKIIDFSKGPDSTNAVTRVSHDNDEIVSWSMGNGHLAGITSGWRDPYPLDGEIFLLCKGKAFYVMNRNGEFEKLYEKPNTDKRNFGMIHDARPCRARPKEPVVMAKTDLTKTNGVFFLSDIYQSRNMRGIKRGSIQKLLVMEDLPKCASRHGPRGEFGGHISIHRILGEVPVEPDGSAYFEVPAVTAVFFAALDKRGIAVKRMQNFTQVMPGERAGCIGCHESRTATTTPIMPGNLAALKRPPSQLIRPKGIPEIFKYTRDIQPIWDKHCLSCHNANDAKGKVVLSGEKTEWKTVSYDRLYEMRQISRASSWSEVGNRPAYGFGSGASPLMKKIDGSHHGVTVSQEEWDKVRLWIDSSAHFQDTYATHNHFEAQVGAPYVKINAGQAGNIGITNQWAYFNANYAQRLQQPMESIAVRRCYRCHGSMAGLGRRRREQDDSHRGWPDCAKPAEWLNNPPYSYTLYNMSDPDHSYFLKAPLAETAGGWGWCKEKDGTPANVFRSKEDPDYRAVVRAIEETVIRLRKMNLSRTEDPGYRPQPFYLEWMKRFDILPATFDILHDPADIPLIDKAYYDSFRWKPIK